MGVLVIACGALAGELRAVLGRSDLGAQVEVVYLPANLHNRPERIVPAVESAISGADGRAVFVAYADCGTGGALDRFIARNPGVRRLPGAHCYEFFAGAERFAALHDEEPGTFYLTDFLAKHFDALVWQGLGLDRHPQLRDTYFSNYRRVVLLSQACTDEIVSAGRAASARLGLDFQYICTGNGAFETAVHVGLRTVPDDEEDHD